MAINLPELVDEVLANIAKVAAYPSQRGIVFGVRFNKEVEHRNNVMNGFRVLILMLSLLIVLGFFYAETEEEDSGSVDMMVYMIAYERACEEAQQPLIDLKTAYRNRLDTLRDQAQSAENLDESLALVDALEKLEESDEPEVKVGFESLDQAHATYLNERVKRQAVVDEKVRHARVNHVEDLKAYQAELTKLNQIEAAIEVKNYIEALPDLQPGGGGNVSALSVASAAPVEPPVVSGPVIELFWRENYQGESVKLEVPVRIDRFAYDKRVKNDQLRSIRIPVGVKVTLGREPVFPMAGCPCQRTLR